MKKIIRYVLSDILRNKIIMAYTLFLFLISMGIFLVEDTPEKSLMSLLTIDLMLIPLISILFSAIYIYNSSEFIELLAAQPIKRKNLWLSVFSGLAISLSLAFLLGYGLPILLFAPTVTGIMMILTGVLLSIIFVGIATLISVYIQEKTRGIGVSLLAWLYFAVLFDGLVLFLLFQLIDYPVEKMIIGLSLFNPIDLVRILVLLKMDVSALMGATGAVFKNNFTGITGTLISFSVLLIWAFVPLYFSLRRFGKRDL